VLLYFEPSEERHGSTVEAQTRRRTIRVGLASSTPTPGNRNLSRFRVPFHQCASPQRPSELMRLAISFSIRPISPAPSRTKSLDLASALFSLLKFTRAYLRGHGCGYRGCGGGWGGWRKGRLIAAHPSTGTHEPIESISNTKPELAMAWGRLVGTIVFGRDHELTIAFRKIPGQWRERKLQRATYPLHCVKLGLQPCLQDCLSAGNLFIPRRFL
jgi:hypothetical protein